MVANIYQPMTSVVQIQTLLFTTSLSFASFLQCSISQRSRLLSVVNQFYEAEILTEYVIRGNAAVLKCSIPSFVADFVKVEAWIDEEGIEITHSGDLGTMAS